MTSTPAADTGSGGPQPGTSTGGLTEAVPTTGVETTNSLTTGAGSSSTTDVDTAAMTTGSTATGETTSQTGATSSSSSSGSSSGGPGPECGDGVMDDGELCDDGNLIDTDACTGQCVPASCGDGLVQAGVEACDDGDGDETLCTVACKLPTCDDQALGGDETDVDCGGACPDCATEEQCLGDDDCLGNCDGGTCVEFKSCLDLKTEMPAAASGVAMIDPDQGGPETPFAVYCEQVTDGGGWTMVLKVDGRLGTFVFPAALWTDANTFNVDPALNRVETKLRSFNTVPVKELLVGMEAPIVAQGPLSLKFIQLSASALNARALFMGNQYQASNIGRLAWKAWISDSSLQLFCNREGLNVTATMAPQNFARVRIGIVANENGPGDCGSPNSYIGVGGGGTGICLPNAVTTTGNRAACSADNGDKDIPGFAVVFVR